jgi:phosphatidylinositol-3-phosphatase
MRLHRSWLARVGLAFAILGVLVAVFFVRGLTLARRALSISGCGTSNVTLTPALPMPTSPARPDLGHVIVVAMENTSAAGIYDSNAAPFLQSMMRRGAHATNFVDQFKPDVVSEPHYVWVEAGTNSFEDTNFCSNDAPSKRNSTASPLHLVNQLENATPVLTWMSYQEGIDPLTTGACPIAASGKYDPKHNPFAFFQDVVGSPPSRTAPRCIAHHRPLSQLSTDLAKRQLADYVFVTPDLCHDMHDSCGSQRVQGGDDWLSRNLPEIITFADETNSVVFLVWDEPSGPGKQMPFIALGPSVKPGYAGAEAYTHSSLLRSIETMFNLDPLPTVAKANDLRDLFVGEVLPQHR